MEQFSGSAIVDEDATAAHLKSAPHLDLVGVTQVGSNVAFTHRRASSSRLLSDFLVL
jgi:hypothetical protein